MQHIMEVQAVRYVATNLAKHGTFQELQFSQAHLDNLRRFMFLFHVVLSLNPRLTFGLIIRHLLRHKRLPVYLPSPECWCIYYVTGSGRECIV